MPSARRRQPTLSATALYFGIYYAGGALGAYVPGLAWQEWGWGGVAATGLAALVVAAAGIAGAGPRHDSALRDMNR